MRLRLSAADLPALSSLTARHTDVPLDPALALLDGWACVGHVLGFYTDRLVNEHYLRTCRQHRSAVELSRLVGYTPRPGVAADVHLAFTLADVDPEAVLEVPAGTRAYSQPGPGETMQAFETGEALTGRPRWNVLRPRLTAPQRVTPDVAELHLRGTATGLVKGSPLVVRIDDTCHLRTVAAVEAVRAASPATEDRTRVVLEESATVTQRRVPTTLSAAVLQALLKEPAVFAAAREELELDPSAILGKDSYAGYGMLESAYPALRGSLAAALGGTVGDDPPAAVSVHAMRVRTALHGHSASLLPWVFDPERQVVSQYREWDVDGTGVADAEPAVGGDGGVAADGAPVPLLSGAVVPLDPEEIALDAVYDTVLPGSFVVILPPPGEAASGDGNGDTSLPGVQTYEVREVRTESRVAFNLPVRVTVLTLDRAWRESVSTHGPARRTVVLAHSEPLDLADVPEEAAVSGAQMELDGYHPGLLPGRRLVVTGERTDLGPEDGDPGAGVTGVSGTEVVMVSAVEHRVAEDVAGQATQDTVHTVLTFAGTGLAYRYRRQSVQVLGNVVPATHGESRAEALGGGDASRRLQTFPLAHAPLTHVSAPSSSGVRSTLEVRVQDLRWQEAPNAAAVLPGERRYVTRTDEGGTAVTFGLGARLPTGQNDVRALYRTGLGAAGNVRAGQISVLASRPTGVTGVTNPAPAAGGADPDELEAIRQRAATGLIALDRLVSAVDLEDFARAFAGIGKARIDPSHGPASAYTLTVAGVDDAPLTGSSVLADLRRALARLGGLEDPPEGGPLRTRGAPEATVTIAVRTALLLAMRARIRLAPDHLWETVQPRLREALFAVFGFAAREIGQVPYPGEAVAVLQGVRGVAWVDLLAFGTIDPGTPDAPNLPADVAAEALALLDVGPAGAVGLPAPPSVDASQIAYLSDAPATLLLEQVPEEVRP
ncbi:baseplate J/gp47 family protein [Geodermatophilus pulveris]|nr:baseplate J/gp47 family protein [Geodermatophilus pulveris]